MNSPALCQDPLRVESILVVDDSASQRQHAVSLCEQAGIARVWEAAHGEEALALLRGNADNAPQVLLIDLEMPHMDGVELIQKVAASGCTPSVIIASSKPPMLLTSVGIIARSLGLPMLAVLNKPLSLERLTRAIDNFPTRARARAGPAQAQPVTAAELKQALAQDQIWPAYQPKVVLASGQLHSAEVLARWSHPLKGEIAPSQFIALAETHELIHDLTLAIAEHALQDLSRWPQPEHAFSIAINLSPLLLSDGHFLDEAMALVERYQQRPESVIWEITESSVMTDIPVALSLLVRLRLKGFGLAIDDYGTGFASMQQLSRIPFTELKIDRSFVHGAASNPHLRALLQSAIALARELNLTSVAEGIELQADQELLQTLECDLGQGFLLAKPMSALQFVDWLKPEVR